MVISILVLSGYQIVEIPCAKLTIALIARRSAEFAGTRFLKRGCNTDGMFAYSKECFRY